MTYRKITFGDNKFYHVFNRSVADEKIFYGIEELERAISLIQFYRYKPLMSYSVFKRISSEEQHRYIEHISRYQALINIHAFSLMPNHHHFLLEQKQDDGVSQFVSNLQNSFAKYFNKKNSRRGSLFCEMFKAVHLNHVTSGLISLDDLDFYPYSSFSCYMENNKMEFVYKDMILAIFGGKERYRAFVRNHADYQKSLHIIKKLTLD